MHHSPAIVLSAFLLAACATPQPGSTLAPFTTDGCSLFPDRWLVGTSDWCRCCIAHDLAYWRGGTAEERLAAGSGLRTAVAGGVGPRR